MANTSSRTLRLLSLLQNHRFWQGHDLAERLGVSPRTLRRDVDRLRELGYPVEAHRGVDGGYQLAAGAALPPLVVDDEEAVAVAVALHTVAAQGAISGIAESALRALAKITQVMPAGLRRHVEALTAMTVPAQWSPGGWGGAGSATAADPGTLTMLALACRDSERIRFAYTAADGTRTDRYAEPHRLVSLGARWYLVAYDLTRHDWRTFRLDRIASPPPATPTIGAPTAGAPPAATPPTATGERFRPRDLPAPDAATYVRNSIGQAYTAYDVEVLIAAPADTVRTRIGRWATVEALSGDADGPGDPVESDGTAEPGAAPARCRVRMTTDALDWPVFALGVVGADFEIVSPPELRDRVAAWATRFTRATATMDG